MNEQSTPASGPAPADVPDAPTDLRRARLWRVTWLISIACLVPALLDGVQRSLQASLTGEPAPSWQRLAFWSGEWIVLGALLPMVCAFALRFPLRPPRIARDLVAHLAGAALLCAAWGLLGTALQVALGLVPAGRPLIAFAASWVLYCLPLSVFIYFATLGCLFAFAYFFEARERESLAARLAKQLAEARLGALRMQLQPHFLFNSLNAIAVLIRDRRNDDAARVTEQLSEILREVLGEADVQEVPLAAEIAFLHRYLAIEQVRFSDRMSVRWDVAPETERGLVPSFVLQPLVENAIRHGVAARREASTVAVAARLENGSLVLSVTNDVPRNAEVAIGRGRGVGLANTRERLATLYGGRGTLSLDRSPRGMIATVRLPFRHAGSPA